MESSGVRRFSSCCSAPTCFLTVRTALHPALPRDGDPLSLSGGKGGEGDVVQFGALTTALAATIGTGNIVGVATAVAAGGPGAVLWMWLTGVFGIATKYAEALLAVKYRVHHRRRHDGRRADVRARARAGHAKWLGVVFAAFTAVAAFGIGNMVQANSISALVRGDTSACPALDHAAAVHDRRSPRS